MPVAVCDRCARLMWFRFQIGSACGYCVGGYYVHSCNWIFYECPLCLGASLGCECDRGMVALPREQLSTGEWTTFSGPDERGCVEISNLAYNESRIQALSESYPW